MFCKNKPSLRRKKKKKGSNLLINVFNNIKMNLEYRPDNL